MLSKNVSGSDAVGPPSTAGPPRRAVRATVIPLLVMGTLAGLLGWSAWPALRPARTIEVTQVIFDRAAGAPEPTAPRDGAAPARRRGVTVQASGWLEADPYYTACTALADGVVAEVLVLEGESVQAGQVVARLVREDSELRLARAEAELAAAMAEVDVASASLAAAETDWAEPVERDRAVEVGRAALAETEAELAQLPALVAAEVAAHERLKEELARSRDALRAKAATAIEVVILEKRAEAQGETVNALRGRGPLLSARADRLRAELHAAERNRELRVTERRALDTARAALARARAAAVRARAARDEAALEVERMTIRAPIDGVVQRRLKVPGDKVVRMMDSPGSAQLLYLFDPRRLQVRVDVPLADAANVFTGQRCEVVVDILPDTVFAGEVTRITHEADLQKNTLQVKVRVVDPSPLLAPEMLTRVKFVADPATGEGWPAGGGGAPGAGAPVGEALAPLAAIDRAGGRSVVWVVRDRRGERGVVRPVDVEVMRMDDAWATVRGGVRPGDLLAADPRGLRAGQVVRITAGPGGGAS